MNSLKTGFVVAVLLAAGFGAYEMFVKPTRMPQNQLSDVTPWTPSEIEFQSSQGNQTSQAAAVTVSADAAGAVASPSSRPSTPKLPEVNIPRDSIPSEGSSSVVGVTDPTTLPESGPTTVLGAVPSTVSPLPHGSYTDGPPLNDASVASNRTPINSSGHLGKVDETGESSPPLITSPVTDGNPQEFQSNISMDNAFANDWRSVQDQLSEGHMADALLALSLWYGSPDLPTDQNEKLNGLLDQLAGTVIYSTHHFMQAPYQVSVGETLNQIADQFKLPWQFLAKVNSIPNPNELVVGQELKVVHGPFRAEIDLDSQELTLFLHRHYAGRFSIRIGQTPFPNSGQYEVVDQMVEGRDYVAGDGSLIPVGAPSNPYGQLSLGLTDGLVIHAGPNRDGGSVGCIMLQQKDLEDICLILSLGSRVTITSQSGTHRSRLSSSALGSTANGY